MAYTRLVGRLVWLLSEGELLRELLMAAVLACGAPRAVWTQYGELITFAR